MASWGRETYEVWTNAWKAHRSFPPPRMHAAFRSLDLGDLESKSKARHGDEKGYILE